MTLKAVKVSKGAKIRNRYNQVPHLTQDTNGKVTNSQLDTNSNKMAKLMSLTSILYIFIFPQLHKVHPVSQTQSGSEHKLKPLGQSMNAE